MADLHRTIDRSIRISRIGRRPAPAARRAPPTSASPSACAGAHAQWQADGTRARRRPYEFWRQWAEYTIDAAQRSVLYWDTLRQRGNQWLEHEAAGKPPVLTYKYEMIADARDVRAAGQLRAGAHHSAQGRRRRRHQAAVRDRRSARGPRPGHRRLQGRLRGRRRAVGRPSGLLRDLLPGSDAGPDARRRHRRRSRVHPHRRRAPSAQPEAGDRRQLPGRLGGDDARRGAAGHRRPARHQRRADVVLVGQRRRVADALRGRPAGRRVAVAVRGGPGRRQVRRRAPRRQLREPESRRTRCGTSGTTCTRTSTPSRSASSSSSAGGAASTCSTRRRSAGSSTTSSSATSCRRARRGWAPAATST